MPAIHHYCYFGALALAVSQLACQAANEKREPLRGRSGSVLPGSLMIEKKLSQITGNAGYKLIDYRACPDSPDTCTHITVETWDKEVLDYEITETPCDKLDENCLGGFTVRHYAANLTRHRLPPGMKEPFRQPSAAKAKLPVQDSMVFKGDFKTNPAVLVSGRIDEQGGSGNRCGRWQGSNSVTSLVKLGKNRLSNIVGDGCDSEIAVFAENGGARLVDTEDDWSKYTDSLVVSLGPVVSIPVAVWVVQPRLDFSAESAGLQAEFNVANEILAQSRCGIRLSPGTIKDSSGARGMPDEPFGCTSIDTLLKPVGYDPTKMNVYVVNDVDRASKAGSACKKGTDNVIIVRNTGRKKHALLSELSRRLDVDPNSDLETPHNGKNRILGNRRVQSRFSAGQCYRMNFSQDSYLNKRGLRDGPVKSCGNQHALGSQCPAQQVEF